MLSPRRRCLALLVLLLAASCGGSATDGREPVVDVKVPDLRGGPGGGAQALEPVPTPTPPPPTPTPTPRPTPVPLGAPRGAELRSSGGAQRGAPNDFCWTAQRGGPGECFDNPPAEQASALVVRSGEAVLLVLDADRPPDEETARAFRGTRSGYPAQPIPPAHETELTLDLEPGEWSLDLCATWYGHGEPICWLFRLDVRAGG